MIREAARAHAEAAIAVFVANMSDENASVRQRAAEAILDRGYGKPAQALTGEDGGPVQLEQIVRRIVDPRN